MKRHEVDFFPVAFCQCSCVPLSFVGIPLTKYQRVMYKTASYAGEVIKIV